MRARLEFPKLQFHKALIENDSIFMHWQALYLQKHSWYNFEKSIGEQFEASGDTMLTFHEAGKIIR